MVPRWCTLVSNLLGLGCCTQDVLVNSDMSHGALHAGHACNQVPSASAKPGAVP
jgi:hypothetical protein